MEQNLSKKIFHMCMILVIIVIFLFAVGILVLRYQVEGESNLPFEISSIKVVSSVDAVDKQDPANKWNLTVNQNNDVYIEILKNESYRKTEVIDSIVLDNFSINKDNEFGTQCFYKPAEDKKVMFKNDKNNQVENITFTGELESNIKKLQISNQGGMIAFRFANDNVANYVSNEAEQVNYQSLLKATNVNNDDLKAIVDFDLTINLNSGKVFKATISLDMPVEDVVESGTTSEEITDLSNIVFKRIEN